MSLSKYCCYSGCPYDAGRFGLCKFHEAETKNLLEGVLKGDVIAPYPSLQIRIQKAREAALRKGWEAEMTEIGLDPEVGKE